MSYYKLDFDKLKNLVHRSSVLKGKSDEIIEKLNEKDWTYVLLYSNLKSVQQEVFQKLI